MLCYLSIRCSTALPAVTLTIMYRVFIRYAQSQTWHGVFLHTHGSDSRDDFRRHPKSWRASTRPQNDDHRPHRRQGVLALPWPRLLSLNISFIVSPRERLRMAPWPCQHYRKKNHNITLSHHSANTATIQMKPASDQINNKSTQALRPSNNDQVNLTSLLQCNAITPILSNVTVAPSQFHCLIIAWMESLT